jgi:FRG domain
LHLNLPEYKFIILAQYLELISRYPNIGWMYRGQGDISWPLRPKSGRPEFHLEGKPNGNHLHIQQRDLGRFHSWRKQAIAYCDKLPANDFECLAYAQHYGLATRLLDWSDNPLVALYFAAEDQSSADGVVFCYLCWTCLDPDEAFLGKLGCVARYSPRPFDRRVLAQSGVFSYHPEPSQQLEPEKAPVEATPIAPEGVNLVAIRVIAALKPILLRELSEIGISRKTLFPDLEGLSDFINWDTKRSAKSSLDSTDAE